MGIASARVLLIEDDQDDYRLVDDLLKDAKRTRFLLDSVKSGEAAKSRIKKDRYDVILMDYRLPDTTGMKLMKWLTDNHFRIPVVLVTSHGDTRLQTEALEAGFCEYLEKGTFNADVLERTLIYAIGLHDRQTQTTDGGGVGLLIQELVSLTRESVTAQTRTTSEISELRNDLNDDMSGIRSDMSNLREHSDQQVQSILKEITKGPWGKLKEGLDWVVAHPWAAVVMILFLALFVTLAVLLINVLDADKINQLWGK